MSTQADPDFEKLRRLLALKKHERPPPAYFGNFLDEFHRRQRTESLRKPGWWEQLTEFFRAEPLLAARYALGTAVALLLCVNAYFLTQPPLPGPVATELAATGEGFSPMPPPSEYADPKPLLVTSNNLNYILDRVHAAPVHYEPTGEF